MLKVLPIQSKIEQEAVCARCGVIYREELMAYSATVDDDLVGVCQFGITDSGGVIYDLKNVIGKTDTEALFIMGRGTLNFIDLCGVHRAFFYSDENADDINEALIHAIGFRKNSSGRWEMDLTNFFDHPCSHGAAGTPNG